MLDRGEQVGASFAMPLETEGSTKRPFAVVREDKSQSLLVRSPIVDGDKFGRIFVESDETRRDEMNNEVFLSRTEA